MLHGIYFCDKQGEAERYVGFDYYDLEPPFSLTGTILKYDGPYGGENQERLQAGWRVGVKYLSLIHIYRGSRDALCPSGRSGYCRD